jgi:phenylacetate-CoA ligase
VRAIVAHAYATVPFYHEVMDHTGLRVRDFRSADDLAQLPIVTGEDLATAPERFLSRQHFGNNSFSISSSGTSGRAKHICYNPAALFLTMAYGFRQRVVLAHFLGSTLGYREMIVVPPRSVSLQLRDFYEARSWVPRRFDFKRGALFPAGNVEDNFAAINSFKPDLIRGFGSYIGALFRLAHEKQLPMHRPKLILYGGEPMADFDRHLIETEVGVPVISGYQAAEALRIAYQCERREGFHINIDHTAVRVLDEGGNPVAPGEKGEIVVSNLLNRAMVLLNYKLGDIVTLGHSACACGRTLPTIERIEGRTGVIQLPEGGIMHESILFENLQSIEGVVQVQVIQETLQSFCLHIVCQPGVDWRATRLRLEGTVRAVLGSAVRQRIMRVDSIPREPGGKVRTFISRLLN